ncbi:uncharacterized protein CTRU02_200214 [Colletotrichum truncatum]|uniref:Uncharacterized protein n=1 Tax=Colletotrichum truncatum TaxID=5467 RepID=A0ACC3ZDU6_COLTU|nr:uncharacterized protein CTRU02_05093 [Colletotrichum truncatum]KAF6794892.1 hypothetical protein CTRU02_05093 [Colletotrichum truncatum]
MSSKGYAVLQGLSQKVASRTIQVTVSPRPASFAERRAVLHSLQKFAKVDVFRKLDDHNSSFISVLADKSKAKELVNMSPLHYQLAMPRPNGSVKTFLTTATSTDPIINSKEPQKAEDSKEAPSEDDHKDFTVHIFPADTYIHSAAIKSSPLHGPWPETRRETAISAILKESLPQDIMTDGLSDWETGGQVPVSARGQLWEDILLGTKSVDASTRAVIDRIQRREQREKLPAIMDGLLHLQEQQRHQ